MRVISGENVDLITPFPITEVGRVFGWNHCYRTFTETDEIPGEEKEFTERMKQILEHCPSYGLIDKYAVTNPKQEAPLIGVGIFEGGAKYHGFLHFASGRKAFKMGLLDEAGALVVKDLFEEKPELLRLGAYTDDRNSPVKALVRRLGFKFEGLCRDMVLKAGKPRNVAYFGLTRRDFECSPTDLTSTNLSNGYDRQDSLQETPSLVEPQQLETDLQTQEIV